MTDPADALEAARRAAAENRPRYGDVAPMRVGPPPFDPARLSEWAVPDPSSYEVRSIRRWGAPITWFKQLLLRLLEQYHAQLIAEQSRFNVTLLGYVRTLEARIAQLEAAAAPADLEEPDAREDDWA